MPEPETVASGLPLSDLRQINEACNRFESAWRAGGRPRIEDHLPAQANRTAGLHALILLDLDYRRQHGDRPQADDYLTRFPDLNPTWLRDALAEPPGCLPPGVFLARLAQLGLLTEAQPKGEPTEVLAQRLVSAGKLEEYQARALMEPLAVPLILGPYALDGWIGAGGMGQVFRATHAHMKRVVAVKVVRGEGRPEVLHRFRHEVEVAARLRHPHLVTAFDAGEQEGVAYLVTEFVDGEDLGRRVRRTGPVPLAVALDWLRQAALGLEHAHQHGVIHRDVKPANLLLDRQGVVRLLDFGLARTTAHLPAAPSEPATDTGLTAAGAFLGTPDFMAPEQADDPSQADERADIYALGCTLHYFLTGRPPYAGESTEAVLRAHRRSPLPRLAGVDALLKRMLAKNPSGRFAAVQDVIAAVDRMGSSSRRGVLLALGGAVVGAALLAGYALWPGDRGGPPDLPTPPVSALPFDGRAEQLRWANHLKRPVESTNDIGMTLALVPPSASGLPAFYIGVTEVTLGQFKTFVAESRPKYVTLAERETGWGWRRDRGWTRAAGYSWRAAGDLELTDEHPAVNMALEDAEAFCRWLTARTGQFYRLPTEAEWEFAARGGSDGHWCFGDDGAQLPLHAWMADSSEDRPHPVRRKRANAFGLHDMHGNLFEWCQATEGVARGGNFRSRASETKCTARQEYPPGEVIPGFRVVCEVGVRTPD